MLFIESASAMKDRIFDITIRVREAPRKNSQKKRITILSNFKTGFVGFLYVDANKQINDERDGRFGCGFQG